ncbi:MAG: hypothetical protein V2B18_06055 [Pseudomonadota bacterium]
MLGKRLSVVFVVLAIAATALNIRLIYDLSPPAVENRDEGRQAPPTGAGGEEAKENPGPTVRVPHVVLKLYLLLCLMVAGFGIIAFRLRRLPLTQLDPLIRTAQEIARGNLNVEAPKHLEGDTGRLAAIINDIAVNYQEVLLLAGTKVGNSLSVLKGVQCMPGADTEALSMDELKKRLDLVQQELNMLSAVLQDFDYYQTYFDGIRVVRYGPDADKKH